MNARPIAMTYGKMTGGTPQASYQSATEGQPTGNKAFDEFQQKIPEDEDAERTGSNGATDQADQA